MGQPIVFVSHFVVKEGQLDRLREFSTEAIRSLEAEKTRSTAQLAYLDEAGTTMSIVHVFADAETMDLHFEGADERSKVAYQFMDPAGWEIYGTPSDAALGMMRAAAAAAGVGLKVAPELVAGFLRERSA
jgi:hypothetical protein